MDLDTVAPRAGIPVKERAASVTPTEEDGSDKDATGASASAKPRQSPPVDVVSAVALQHFFENPFPQELRRLLVNAAAHCTPQRLQSTGQELQRMAFIAAICRDYPDVR